MGSGRSTTLRLCRPSPCSRNPSGRVPLDQLPDRLGEQDLARVAKQCQPHGPSPARPGVVAGTWHRPAPCAAPGTQPASAAGIAGSARDQSACCRAHAAPRASPACTKTHTAPSCASGGSTSRPSCGGHDALQLCGKVGMGRRAGGRWRRARKVRAPAGSVGEGWHLHSRGVAFRSRGRTMCAGGTARGDEGIPQVGLLRRRERQRGRQGCS